MVTLRKRVRSDEISTHPTRRAEKNPPKKPRASRSSESKETGSKNYEQARDERIKENLLRMQKLGIFDLTQKLKSQFESSRPALKKTPKPKCLASVPLPRRRSSRLQKVTPVGYAELRPKREENSTWETKVLLEDGSVPEVYTEEHEKLLGTCTMPWELFKDGYGTDGRRIYDQVNGKTCHQCRQKTLGHRTHCSKCNLVQGQFCGDCLYMRYGENVLEANENPEWVCPVCRGICNCSLCRIKKGWVPTGTLYRTISSLGFKSVAHFLIQTRRSVPNSADPVSIFPSSAKRSLRFADTEDMEADSHNGNEVDDEGNNDIIGVASKSSKECKNMQAEEYPTVKQIDKNKQKKPASQILTSQTILKSAPRLKSERGSNSAAGLNSRMKGGPKMRIKVAVSRPVFVKQFSQDEKDAGIPSGVKPSEVLMVSEDGVVHFSHESNPKPNAVPRLSSDGILHFVWESDPKPTAAPENCSNGDCCGAGEAQAVAVPSENEVKPRSVPQQSSDNVIHAASHYCPEPATPGTASLSDICNGGAVGESNRDVETEPCSDSIPSIASPGKLKPTASVGNGALGAEASGVVANLSSVTTVPVALESTSKTTGSQGLALGGVCRDTVAVMDIGCAASECMPKRDAETQPCLDGIPSVASPCKLKPTVAPDLSSVDVGNGTMGAGVKGDAVELSKDVIPIALQSKPNTTGPEAPLLGAVCSSALGVIESVGLASESVSDRDAETLLHSDGVPSVESARKLKSTVPPDLSSVDVGKGVLGAEALGGTMDPSSDNVIPVALHENGTSEMTDTSGVASDSGLELAMSPNASSSGRVLVALQSELEPPETPELSSDSLSIGKFGSSNGIAGTTQRKRLSETSVVPSSNWNSIAGRLKLRRCGMLA